MLESVQYVFQTRKDGLSKREVLNEFQKHLLSPTQKNIMTIAEAFVEEGIQKGIKKGMQQFRSSLLRQIEQRFPNQITSNQRQLIEQADSEDLALWSEKLMDTNSIGEIFI